MTAHARLAPSAADSWMVCAGYPNAVAGIPDRATIYAAQGTVAHRIDELCLTLGLEAADFIGAKMSADGFSFDVTEEWAEHLQPGLDRVEELGGEMFVEYRVNLSHWMPGQFGTLDTGLVRPDLIVIRDLKFGEGVPVSPVENRQLMLYALGFWRNVARHRTAAKRFLLIIDQPRASGGGGEWPVTLDELLQFGEEVKAAAKRTEDPNAPRTASAKGCLFCPAKGTCAEFWRFNLDLVGMSFDDLDGEGEPNLPRALTAERRSYVVRHASMFRTWLDGLHEDTLADALAGRPTPGLKAVNGRKPARRWNDEAEAEDALERVLSREQIFTKKLISPAQAEKLISGLRRHKRLSALVDYGSPKPVLVPEADERPAVKATADKFDDLM